MSETSWSKERMKTKLEIWPQRPGTSLPRNHHVLPHQWGWYVWFWYGVACSVRGGTSLEGWHVQWGCMFGFGTGWHISGGGTSVGSGKSLGWHISSGGFDFGPKILGWWQGGWHPWGCVKLNQRSSPAWTTVCSNTTSHLFQRQWSNKSEHCSVWCNCGYMYMDRKHFQSWTLEKEVRCKMKHILFFARCLFHFSVANCVTECPNAISTGENKLRSSFCVLKCQQQNYFSFMWL